MTALLEEFKPYVDKHYSLKDLFDKKQTEDEALSFNKFKVSATKRAVMAGLKISPWICGVIFMFTFSEITLGKLGAQFDWNGSFIDALERFLESNKYWLEPLNIIAVSGLIGFGTNFIAIRMLFRPVERRPIWGQGLIPAQRERIIYSLAKGMHKHILNPELIRKRIQDTGLVQKINNWIMDGTYDLVLDQEMRAHLKDAIFAGIEQLANRDDIRNDIRQLIDGKLEANLDTGVKKFLLQTYKKYQKEDYDKAIDQLVHDLPKLAIDVVEKVEHELDGLGSYIKAKKDFTEEQIMNVLLDTLDRIDIVHLLAKQMEHFDEAKLERMVWEATNEQLLYIQYLGTVLGIFGGLLIWKPELFGPAYVLLLGAMYLLDQGIVKLRNTRS
ncbi:DUF445 family protein [Pontibacter sp. G13]|uniref:DUF445 domain-containing protein n=1 Tax=Pontibacter sp. G13 TaxID=3074898 RepID=UPI00288A4E1D|nr:DUF445 family protein [Pontibacter sp. G13]WNJ18081.1 DUF445 family protein [Pontibacter sp. G13]